MGRQPSKTCKYGHLKTADNVYVWISYSRTAPGKQRIQRKCKYCSLQNAKKQAEKRGPKQVCSKGHSLTGDNIRPYTYHRDGVKYDGKRCVKCADERIECRESKKEKMNTLYTRSE